MVIKVYVAMISCSQEIKKNQQRAVMILESKKIPYTIIDITDPANEDSKDYMVETATPKEGCKVPVTPQLFNEADYCGDYEALDMANECDTLGDFLKLTEEEKKDIKIGITGIIPKDKTEENETHITNGVSASREESPVKAPVNEPEANDAVESQPLENVTSPDAEVASPEETERIDTADTEPAEVVDVESNEHPKMEEESPAVDEVEANVNETTDEVREEPSTVGVEEEGSPAAEPEEA